MGLYVKTSKDNYGVGKVERTQRLLGKDKRDFEGDYWGRYAKLVKVNYQKNQR